MAADSKRLSWAVSRLSQDPNATRMLRRLTYRAISASLDAILAKQQSSNAAADGWVARAARSWMEGKSKKALEWETSQQSQAGHSEALGGNRIRTACTTDGGRAPKMTAPNTMSKYRRRWTGWPSGEFATLNSSFPFTIPSVPAGVFLFGQAPAPRAHMPGAVAVPSGMGTAARKFHSTALGRQAGAPFGSETDHGVVATDNAAIASQLMPGEPGI
ncbi:hypothetical protein FBU59_006183, partial [Linderina macrospora]